MHFAYQVILQDGTKKAFAANKNAALSFMAGKTGAKLELTNHNARRGVETVRQQAGSQEAEHGPLCMCAKCFS